MTQVVYIHTAGERYSPGDVTQLPTETEPATDPGRQSQPSETLGLDSLSFTHVLGTMDEILVRVKCVFLYLSLRNQENSAVRLSTVGLLRSPSGLTNSTYILGRSNRSLLMKCSIRRNTKLGVENQCRRTRRRFEEPPTSTPSTADFFFLLQSLFHLLACGGALWLSTHVTAVENR